MTEETTTEQLAEIEGQATEYTPPEGWRVLAVGERLRDGDVTVRRDGYQYPTERVGGWVGSNQRYIRPIEPQPQAEPVPQPQPEPVQVPEPQAESTPATKYTPPDGWRVVQFGEQLLPGDVWVNWEGTVSRPDIQHGDGTTASGGRYIRRIKQEPEPQPEPHAATIEELRSEVSYVQRLLGESRQRVTHLEELVGSLRTINRVCENAVRDAGKENSALRNQLTAVKAELASVAADRQRLRVELDAAQQVPADSPELRQLRADLEQVTLGRDTYRDGYNRVLSDLETARETAKAEAVEAIAEWLVPIRTCGSQALATAVVSNLPHIMRSLTGLEDEDIE